MRGPGLVAGKVTQRQARADGAVSRGSGEDADRERTQEQGAEDRRHDPGDDERHSVAVGQCETADTAVISAAAAIAEWRAASAEADALKARAGWGGGRRFAPATRRLP